MNLTWVGREVSKGMGTVISIDTVPKRAGSTGLKDDQDGAR